jgi:hypothetical protein
MWGYRIGLIIDMHYVLGISVVNGTPLKKYVNCFEQG